MRQIKTSSSEVAAEQEASFGEPARQRDWSHVSQLPTAVTVSVPIAPFHVKDVLALVPGALIASNWREDSDVPLLAGRVQLGWVVFEATDEDLGVRITRVL
jgi:flagellar motor switch/type III secretory pathway protein FliN